jgi:RNA polymerase sigma-70 factor, ECF subfamily
MKRPGPSTVEGNRKMAKAIDTDACLIERFARGDTAAFDRLFLKYQDYVYNICLGVVGNPEDARDCTQETFLKVYKNAKEFRSQSALSTWIYRIAVNQCLGSLRKRPKSPVASLDDENCKELPDTAPPPWMSAERKAEEQEVREIMDGLTPDYKTVLVLRYYQELSYEEMMQVLGWNLAVVKVKLHRARQAFAKQYAARQKTQGATE